MDHGHGLRVTERAQRGGQDWVVQDVQARLLRTWAVNAAAHACRLSKLDPSWGSEVHRLAGGWLVLSGPGLYVNRAMGVGVDSDPSAADLAFLTERSREVGVLPAIEVTSSTRPETAELLRDAGLRHEADLDVTALVRPINGRTIDAPDDVVVEPVRSEADLRLWQETSAAGWGHRDAEARRASDAFTVAAHAIDGDGMSIACDAADHRPLGCASVTIRDGIATLGGMSTIPADRGRGVQAALLRHRLRHAADHGCDLASTTAATGGDSERNLRRHGFTPRFVIQTWLLR